MARIASIQAVEILDSRGWPTPFVRVTTDTGDVGEASVPSGASTGEFEALELRDGDPDRYFGKGVQKAIAAIEGPIAELLRGENVLDQRRIDTLMIKADGTDNKSFFGANAVLGVSLAVARAAAASERKPLYRYLAPKSRYRIPVPMMNIVNGGAHANNSLDIQEFMICPVGASSFAEAVRYGSEIFHSLRKILQEKGVSTAVGDEGGFAPNWSRPEEALEGILRAIEARGYRPGEDVTLALDVAASELYDPLTKRYMEKKQGSRGKARTSEEQVEFFLGLVASYPIDSIEDGMAEQDPEGWQLLTSKLGSSIRLIGDDNFVTNEKFLREGIRKGIANGVLIKPNQIGTLTETLDCIACAKKGGYTTVVSHRSGETEDSFIADLAVAVEADRIKTGSLSRSDRTAKYNRLLCIEREMLLEDLEIW